MLSDTLQQLLQDLKDNSVYVVADDESNIFDLFQNIDLVLDPRLTRDELKGNGKGLSCRLQRITSIEIDLNVLELTYTNLNEKKTIINWMKKIHLNKVNNVKIIADMERMLTKLINIFQRV